LFIQYLIQFNDPFYARSQETNKDIKKKLEDIYQTRGVVKGSLQMLCGI